MKLLFDNNLSQKLPSRLADVFSNASHVTLMGLDTASDLQVWEVAERDGYCLVTKDSDFNELFLARGFHPKVIWLRVGNCTTMAVEQLLRSQQTVIREFIEDSSAGLLELQ